MITKRYGPAALALTAALTLGISGCDGGPFGVNGGNVRFVLSSAADAAISGVDAATPTATTATQPTTDGIAATPSLHDGEDGHSRNPFFASANVTFTSILARDADGVLVNVDGMELPATVDVVTMETGRSITLPDGELQPGTYDQVVVVMSQVQGVTYDGTTITIDPPGGGWTAIIPICPFDVADGATAVVGLQLSLSRSFFWRDNRYHFEPRFMCDQTPGPEPETTG